jgi:CelD/BcsL family acetyltransferase involved in cellulose biosynthesis
MAHLELEPLRHMGLLTAGPVPLAGDGPMRRVAHGDLVVETRPLALGGSLVAAWRSLALRSVQPNPFLSPDAALLAAQHLPEASGHVLKLVYNVAAQPERLIGLWICRPRRRGLGPGLVRGLSHPFMSDGAPLLDRQLAVEAASALLQDLANDDPGAAGVVFPLIALDDPAALALKQAARLAGRPVALIEAHQRAALMRGDAPAGGTTGREIARLKRRLAERGPVAHLVARDAAAVRDAFERFLALEASGWKAARGTAILCETRQASFWRTFARVLARQGQMEVHELQLADVTIASQVVLRDRDRAFAMKTTYDEALARLAPGVTLSDLVGRAVLADKGLALIDSCAVPGHAMIERVWLGRLAVGDLAIGLGGDFETALRRDEARRHVRAAVKRIWRRLRGYTR